MSGPHQEERSEVDHLRRLGDSLDVLADNRPEGLDRRFWQASATYTRWAADRIDTLEAENERLTALCAEHRHAIDAGDAAWHELNDSTGLNPGEIVAVPNNLPDPESWECQTRGGGWWPVSPHDRGRYIIRRRPAPSEQGAGE